MAESADPATPARGGRRGPDRRTTDRRRKERRTPLPAWRRPWALVLYGAFGTLLVVLFLRGTDEATKRTTVTREVLPAPISRTVVAAPSAAGHVEDARSAADYERLLAEGDAAVGRRVHAELYCGAINTIALRPGEPVYAPVAALADSSGQVPAAECRWGRGRGVRRQEMMLLVPPPLAEAFARAPIVSEAFVPRRHIRAEIEWVGRSSALALRSIGVLRRLER